MSHRKRAARGRWRKYRPKRFHRCRRDGLVSPWIVAQFADDFWRNIEGRRTLNLGA